MNDWDEIKRLAADFQRTQTSDTLQRISERNCIDIVKKLTDLSLIELIYTCDGKQFITPSHLLKEIEDEIYVNGGRMHLHDLAANLNVDYQHVENKAKDLAKNKPEEYSLILGQVVHSIYKTTLGKQISDWMLTTGQLSIAEFAKSLDLPSEFLLTIVKELLPRVMDDFVVSQDERTYYTTDMMDRYKSIIAGTLSAISKPTTVASIMKRLDIPERIFMPTVEGLIKEGRIDAVVENRLFIPAVYAREQNEWITKFYSSNFYIEYDVLSRMDIKQPKAFLKKRFPEGIHLKTCFLSPNLFSQVESLIEECIASSSWIDISTMVPSAIEAEDIELLFQEVLKKNKQFASSCLIFNQTNICSLKYIAVCKSSFNLLMQDRAREHLNQGKLINYFLGGKLKNPSRNEVQSSKEKVEDPPTEDKDQSGEDVRKDVSTKDDKKSAQATDDQEDDQPASKSSRKERVGKDKKVKHDVDDIEDSDEEHGGKKSKGKKSGGGTQGREIKQKAVKKKYIPGNRGNQKHNDNSDEEPVSKNPRSNKGRAARRAMSPERPGGVLKSKNKQAATPVAQKEPLLFMSTNEIVEKLRRESDGSSEAAIEFYEQIAQMIEVDLNNTYEALAKEILDEYLKSQTEETEESENVGADVDVVD